ncbi:MAG: hypothetical protein JEY99_04400 [Spirochaetales bacterium]|nr:hypothetical protein [Spirochaetales bacterium]
MKKKSTFDIGRIIAILISIMVGILILTGILLWGIGMPPRNLPEPKW